MSGRIQGVVLRPRGRVLGLARGGALPRAAVRMRAQRGLGRLGDFVILGALPMFGQVFHYMVDVPPLYLLSKAWPFLMAPFALWGMVVLRIPARVVHLTMLVWLLAVTPMISILHLGNSFPDAMTTTVKIWPFTYVFALGALLLWLRPTRETLRRQLIGLGGATFLIMGLLWFIAPESWYSSSDQDTKLFMWELERGYRIYMPMFFGMLLIFALNRSMWERFVIWKPAAIVVCFVMMNSIYKQRTAIASAAVAVAFGGLMSLRRWRIPAFAVAGVVGMAGLAFLVARSQVVSQLQENLGNSLAIRQISVQTAWNYIAADPLRWIFGVGGTTRFGEVTLTQLFNNRMFYLADIGWLGVLFEYGAIGVGLMLAVHLIGLACAIKWGRADDPLTCAFADYIVYLLAASSVYSVVFTPGELTTVMALSYYFARLAPRIEAGQA